MQLPLVFLPGMMCDARIFSPQIARFSGERIITVAPVNGADTIELIASKILMLMPPKFVLLGLSLGGIVAMEIVRQAPKRVSNLVLMDTNHSAELLSVRLKREPQIKSVEEGKLLEVMRQEMKPNYMIQEEKSSKISDLCMRMALDLGEKVFIDQSRALASRADQTLTLSRINIPTLFLCGEHDRLCPIEKHQEMASLVTGSSIEIISNSGHLPTLENAKNVNGVLEKWLK